MRDKSTAKKIFTRTNALQAFRFCVVGGINTLLTLSIIFVLLYYDINYITANLIGYAAGFINSFIMNRSWTFKSRGSMRREVILYIIVYLITYGIQMIALIACRDAAGFPDRTATLIAMIFFTVPNFFGNKYLTFKR